MTGTEKGRGDGEGVRALRPLVPSMVFLTRGAGVHKDKLTSRELAMLDAGVEKVNMVKCTSIIPPGCRIIGRDEGRRLLVPGQVAFAILAENNTEEPHRLISAAIGVAKPDDDECRRPCGLSTRSARASSRRTQSAAASSACGRSAGLAVETGRPVDELAAEEGRGQSKKSGPPSRWAARGGVCPARTSG